LKWGLIRDQVGCQAAIAGKPAPTGIGGIRKLFTTQKAER